MEVIGCAASVSQLLVYVTASAFRLHRLCSVLRNGTSIYRDEETNVSLLLAILHRLPGQDKQAKDSIFPILLGITDVARQTLHLLQPKTICGINWTPLLSHGKIQLAFQSLEEKRRLLHLYISQAHHEALIDLRDTIGRTGMANSPESFVEKSTESTESTESTGSPRSTGTPAAADYEPLPSKAESSSSTTGASMDGTPTQKVSTSRTVLNVKTISTKLGPESITNACVVLRPRCKNSWHRLAHEPRDLPRRNQLLF